MLNKKDFTALVQSDDKMTTYKECRRYGTIGNDSEFTVNDGEHAGAHRIITINHYNTDYLFHLLNGDVIEILVRG